MSSLTEYKCLNCGGTMSFDSGSQQMKCPYCSTSFDAETLRIYDEESSRQPSEELRWDLGAGTEWKEGEQEGILVYNCSSCGGEIISDKNTLASSCPYCSSNVVMSGQLAGVLRPDLVIPFKLDKQAAKESLNAHLQKKRFLPKIFKDENHIDEIKGIYVPFWLFDADAQASFRYRAEKQRKWSDSQNNYQETSHYYVFREGSIGFDLIPADSSSKIADDLMDSIEPFNYSEAKEFTSAYLAGYLADKYDIEPEVCEERANERVKQSTQEAFAATVKGYSNVRTDYSSIRLVNGKAKYALLPVWILNTTWKDEKFIFAMNGQTGKFVGNLPLDKGAYWRTFGTLAAVISAVVFGLQWLIL